MGGFPVSETLQLGEHQLTPVEAFDLRSATRNRGCWRGYQWQPAAAVTDTGLEPECHSNALLRLQLDTFGELVREKAATDFLIACTHENTIALCAAIFADQLVLI